MSKSIGPLLRKRRENQSLTIEQAASATRIRARLLVAIEESDFAALPSATQLRGFIRAYADFLGLDSEILLAELQGDDELKPIVIEPIQQKSQNIEVPNSYQPEIQPSQDAAAIFSEIGMQLITRRELLGLALDDVERHTHIRQHYLLALEAGKLDDLPSPVQGRGMLSNYAAFLGMDADALLLLFAEGLQTQLQIRKAASPQPDQEPIRERDKPPSLFQRLITPDTIIGGLIVFALAAFVLWGIIRVYGNDSNTIPTSNPPSIAEVLLATATPSDTPTPRPVTDTPVSRAPLFPTPVIPTDPAEGGTTSTEGAGAAVQVYLTVQQRTFMRVLVDGEVQFDGRVLPGSAYPFSAKTQIEVVAGNGAGLQVFFNGVDLGLMGQIGEIVHQVFTMQGFFTPTPTNTSTPSNTPMVPTTPTEIPLNILGTPTP